MEKVLLEEIDRLRKLMNLKKKNDTKLDVKHIKQPTGNSCGPTCIKMVGDFLKAKTPSIDDICNMCGTDWVVGTPPDKMKVGLDELGIKYIEHISEREPYQSIKNTIDKGNVAIVRTITKGVPHWIVIYGYDENMFFVNDPWLGQIKYTENQLGDIWKVRDFFYFEIIIKKKDLEKSKKIVIRKMKPKDMDVIFPKLSSVFHLTGLSNKEILKFLRKANINKSVVATLNDKVVGFYFLGDNQIPPGGEDYEKLKNLVGIEGIGLGVFNEYKNLGIGKKLIEYSQNIPGVDYVWGGQLKSLKNIDDWLKRRKLYSDKDNLYTTYQLLKK